MDVLMLVSAVVLDFGGESSPPSRGPLPVVPATEHSSTGDPHPLFPLLKTPTEITGFDLETPPNLEWPTGTSEPDFGGPNVSIFVPLGKSNPPQNDSPQHPLFVPLSPNPTED